MKYMRELKVGLLAIVCGFLLFFGFFYLKGVNIFSSTRSYYGIYAQVDGLAEQAPVFIRGYKVGQVDAIQYDFSRDSAFTVQISIDQNIQIPQGTRMCLVPNGLLGGTAIELFIPIYALVDSFIVPEKTILPTDIELGVVEQLQTGLLASLDSTVAEVQYLITQLNAMPIQSIAANLDATSCELHRIMRFQIPTLIADADTAIVNIQGLAENLRSANIASTIYRADTAIMQVNSILTKVQYADGTLNKLVNDSSLYLSVQQVAFSADSLLVDLKENPKRYVHFSLFGAKDKSKKKK